ncbi:hypothetical protein CLOM_g882 [Closterium sp. NIES-68]|nr:hypothetical protein CLOM_g882 [Closterium sp. NIES-68]GJP65935.1 hypothetical protein CLOP_g22831 [Closterium sp. NIES-67]
MALAFPSLLSTVAPLPSSLWSANLSAPYPTNAPWQNFVLGDGGSPEVVPPYVVKSSEGRISWGAPPRTAQPGFIIQAFIATLMLSTLEGLSTHQVATYDDTTVTLAYSSSSASSSPSSSSPVLSVPLVRGSPYLTFLFASPGATPVIATDHALTDAQSSGDHTKHKITFNNGQTWVLYASSPLAFTVSNNTLTATSPFTGTLRAALLPGNSPAEEEAVLDAYAGAVVVGGDAKVRPWRIKYQWKVAPWGSDSPAAATMDGSVTPLMLALPIHRRMRLKAYTSANPTPPPPVYPPIPPVTPPPTTPPPVTSPPSSAPPSAPSSAPASAPASASASAPPPCTPILPFTIAALSSSSFLAASAEGAAEAVAAAAPQSAAPQTTPSLMPSPTPAAATPSPSVLVYLTLDGPAVGVAGANWDVKVPPLAASWHSPRLSSDPALLTSLRSALQTDIAALTPITITSTYYFGKTAARAARLALIAEQLGETAAAGKAVAVVRDALTLWFNGSFQGNSLLYDPAWGGVVSSSGAADSGADFGMGCFNDHHFHFGYWLYAAAVVAKADPTWAMTHRHAVLNLVSDIMSPRATAAFPRLRHFDLYALHSWASGLFEFGDGRNQESFSEAVNGYHGVALLGLAFGDMHLANLGATLAAVEAVAAQTLIQVPQGGDGGAGGSGDGASPSASPSAPPSPSPSPSPAAAAAASAPGSLPSPSSSSSLLSTAALAAAATSTSPDYDPIFAAPNRLLGMVWANKRDAGLWFAAAEQTDKRVGIQVLPITPFLSRLFPDAAFNRQVVQWVLPVLAGDATTDEWRGFAWALQATYDPAAARANIEELEAFDDGNSKSNMLWWLAANTP